MRNTRPVFAFILLVSLQSLCAPLGVPGQGDPTDAPATSAPVTPVPGTATSTGAATETPLAESVGTINLVASQVEIGPLDQLQFLEGLQDFHNGDGVRVSGGGKGELTLDDGIQLLLFNDTQVDRVDVSVSPNETRLRLVEQGLDGYVPPGETFIAEMPNGAVFTILGTNFVILYNTDTEVATAGNFDGSVLFTPPGGTQEDLPAGQMVNIPEQGGVEQMVLPFTPEEFEEAVDGAGTPTGGLTALIEQYQIEPMVFTGEEVGRMTHEILSSAAFSPDGRYVVSGGCDEITTSCQAGGVRVWEAVGGSLVARMSHGEYVHSVAFSPDGKYVVSGSCDDVSEVCSAGSARVWEVATGKEVASVSHGDAVSLVLFNPDGRYVLSGSEDGTLRVWEALTGGDVARMKQTGRVHSAAFSPDGSYVASGGSDGLARVWELKTGREIAHMDHGSGSVVVAVSPDGSYVVSGVAPIFGPAGRVPGADVAWEASSGSVIASVTDEGAAQEVSFSPAGKYSLSGSAEAGAIQTAPDQIILWDATSGEEVARTRAGGGVGQLVFSPDGKYVVASINNFTAESASGTVLVWEAATGRETRMNHDPAVQGVDVSPDGRYVVSANTFGTILVWDAFGGREVAHMTPDSTLHSVAFSPDGRYVLSVSEDGTARVWLWQTNQPR